MRLHRRTLITLGIFFAISALSSALVAIHYAHLPATYLGIGRYTVNVQLEQSGELYRAANVTFRGVEVGKVKTVRLTETGAEAVLSLKSGVAVPADLTARVGSATAIGEQYVDLVPRSRNGPLLKDGDVISRDRTVVPPNINSLLAAADRGLNAIPRDDLKTVVDESYAAVGGLGPALSRLLTNGPKLAIGARDNLDALLTMIDQSMPVFDSQIDSSDSIQGWAAHMANITTQLRHVEENERSAGTDGGALSGLVQLGGPFFSSVQQVFDRVTPSLPTVLDNLVPVSDVALTYRDNIEALLVQFPQIVADSQAIMLPGKDLKSNVRGVGLSFNLNLNVPPPCATGFIPVAQQRSPVFTDTPPRPPGLFYCRIPQDSQFNAVRGARNYPCVTRPGKRAATVKLCESDEPYIPLNDGYNWKGDPNATLTGQNVPQFNPGEQIPAGYPGGPPIEGVPAAPDNTLSAPPPILGFEFDAVSGEFVGPDGQRFRQQTTGLVDKERTWEQMLMPPTAN